MDEKSGSNVVDVGVDLSEFYMSVEWDILEVPAVRWVLKSFDLIPRDARIVVINRTRVLQKF